MKAIVQDRYGSADVLEFRDIEDPVVGEDDVLVRVHAAGCGPDVWHLMTGHAVHGAARDRASASRRSRVRGWDVAGTVEAVGAKVTGFEPGDEVMGTAEGLVRRARGRPRPTSWSRSRADLTFEQAAAAPDLGHHRPAGASAT